jgi:uncharacterized protein (DUF2126 family)
VDEELAAADVRLTMGGEPTFVSIDDFEAGEWNADAVGPTKRAKADALIRRLRERFAPGGLLHYGQGKWYPGETLPRWTFSLYWRRDGLPMWRDPALVAHEGEATAATAADAERLLRGIAGNLGLAGDTVAPAYEDPASWILAEAKLPENVTPENSKLESAEERGRIARVFARGLTTPAGFVLPIQRWQAKHQRTGWRSERWKLRRDHLFLIPGDSPVGYRLPFSSLSFVPPESYPYIHPADPTEEREPLPDYHDIVRGIESPASLAAAARRELPSARVRADEARQDRREQSLVELEGSVRTAISASSCRRSATLEDYLELIAAAEDAARSIGLPIQIEGYAPPYDPRLNVIRVAPDPGRHRGEHPSGGELGGMRRDHHGRLRGSAAEPARRRQVHDRRQAHRHRRRQPRRGRRRDAVGQPVPAPAGPAQEPRAALAAASVAELPVLGPVHRADLAGAARRRGPARQPLRARDRAARRSRRPAKDDARPALAGRPAVPQPARRRHRQHAPLAEICIDKLYSPDGPTGRLGLVEFRGFEMPPNARMSLAQQLLVRALIARFWKARCRAASPAGARRCTTASCCRISSGRTFLDVLADLRAHGFDARPGLVRRAARIPLPVLRRGRATRA